ncbi:MAG TPA: PQQ-dependent dehydrogenase, methanol/ethanol family [Pseudomonadales bacterium]
MKRAYAPTVGLALALLTAACGPADEQPSSPASPPPATDAAPANASAFAPASFGNVTFERLLNADSEPGQWLTEGRDFGKGHYSTLDQINRDNVGQLGLAWDYQMGTTRGQEATPVMIDGVLYAAGTTGRVYALNAATGEEIWTFDPMSDGQVNRYTCCDEVNRGLQVFEGAVYVASLDGRLFSLDAETGAVNWEVDTLIYKDRAYTSSGAPEVAGDVVVIGNAGADYDARGYLSAYNRETGELAWRFFIVPGDPANGFEHPEMEMAAATWDPNSRWDVGGGGTAWNAMAYDPVLNLLYVGTGNSALFNWHERSPSGGDNLFLASILAINPDTGRLAWHYQQVPRESWDFTATQPMILADIQWAGETRQVLMQAPKAGFFYILDRATGELLSADKYVPVNWAFGVDLETGRPDINPEVDYTAGGGPVFVYPSGMGGHAWNPMSYDPETGLVYIPSIEGGALMQDTTDGHEYRPKQANSGNSVLFGDMLLADPDTMPGEMGEALRIIQEEGRHLSRAALKAWNPLTSEVVWEQEGSGWWDRAGTLATSGGLVFQGTDTGFLRAFDKNTGEELLNLEVGTSIMAAPITYEIDGVQYLAVQAGWGGGGWFAPHPTSAVITRGNANRIIAFKLGGAVPQLPPEVSAREPIPQPPQQAASAEAIAQGQGLFARNCAICHANSDTGLTPDLRRLSPETHEAFLGIVLYGGRRFRGMPQFDDVLNEEQANAIHAYLIDLAWQGYDAQQAGQANDAPVQASETGH